MGGSRRSSAKTCPRCSMRGAGTRKVFGCDPETLRKNVIAAGAEEALWLQGARDGRRGGGLPRGPGARGRGHLRLISWNVQDTSENDIEDIANAIVGAFGNIWDIAAIQELKKTDKKMIRDDRHQELRMQEAVERNQRGRRHGSGHTSKTVPNQHHEHPCTVPHRPPTRGTRRADDGARLAAQRQAMAEGLDGRLQHAAQGYARAAAIA